MLYKYGPTIPANTSKAAATEQTVKLSPGRISSVIVTFPAGCEGLVGIRILRGSFQLWPLTTTDWLVGDDQTYTIEASQELRSGETRLRLLTHNLDTANDHTPLIAFTVDAVPSAKPQHLGIVTAELPEYVREDVKALAGICQQSFELSQQMGERIVPLLTAILDRLEPDISTRLRSMSLDELSKL